MSKKIIICIHGIRRQEKWYETLEEFEELEKYDLKIFDYGFFSLLDFINPFSREKTLKMFQKFYSDICINCKDYPHVICHSFGTYIFFKAVEKYKSIKFDRVILCGSILNENLDWKSYFENKQIKRIYNDYGTRDWIVDISKFILSDSGKSGMVGFSIRGKYNKEKHFLQNPNNFKHSDYFLPLHMKNNWVPFIIDKQAYDKNILPDKIFKRLQDTNQFHSNNEVIFNKIVYNAFIDNDGNYFAKYQYEMKLSKNPFSFYTSADSMSNYNKMNFFALDLSSRKKLNVELNSNQDKNNEKKIDIYFDNFQSNNTYKLINNFVWERTIGLSNGDTDHFAFSNANFVEVELIFESKLKNAKLILIRNSIPIKTIDIHDVQENNRYKYYYSYQKTEDENIDGVIFYFEGIVKNESIMEAKLINKKNNVSYLYCTKDDIKNIYLLEKNSIELDNSATEQTLMERLLMFPDGFIVAKNSNNDIIGYIESTIFYDWDFKSFQDISHFSTQFNQKADTLYVIFIAVHPEYRERGVATNLLKSLEKNILKQYPNIKKIKLIAKGDYIGLYQKQAEFKFIDSLNSFLNSGKHAIMEKEIK